MGTGPAGRLASVLASEADADGSAGPTLPRLVLAAHLRRLRGERGVSRAAAARTVGSEDRLAALESGMTRCGLDDVMALCDLYEVDEHATRVTLLELARQSHRPGWWHSHRKIIPTWFLPYLGAEQAAVVIRCYAVQLVPDLLQTPEYARAHITSAWHVGPKAEIDAMVGLRMRRQTILHRSKPAFLWTILDEAALRRPVGGRATMFRQIEHLLEMCEKPNIAIQILPLESADHVALGGPMTLLRLPSEDLADVVFTEQLGNATYPDRPGDRDFHRHAMNVLATQALTPARTKPILREMISSL